VRHRRPQPGARDDPASVVTAALLGICALLASFGARAQDIPAPHSGLAAPIDRHALVSRHDVTFRRIDPTAASMVGNGNFAFTADITGLQTFPEQYSPLVPLLTQSQWGWHSFPNPAHYQYADSLVPVQVHGSTQYYPWLRDGSEANRPAIAWLRENPHRIALGRVSLYLVSKGGQPARFSDLSDTQQTLDLWSGTLHSRFVFDGEPVQVQTQVHPDLDMLIVTLTGPALAAKRLGIALQFPGVSRNLNPDPSDWDDPQSHRTSITAQTAQRLSLARQLDATRYYVTVGASRDVTFDRLAPHSFRMVAASNADGPLRSAAGDGTPGLPLPGGNTDTITFMVLFSQQPHPGALPESAAAQAAVADYWHRYWSTGGVIDLSGSGDPRAAELERRIVLSQYLMAVNAAGTLPPQEEGLFSNSWYGKFHLEMHLWHEGQFALWGHPGLLERSMPWYLAHLAEAKARAHAHAAQGAWWPKMVGPDGRESPSTINPFIMWQQPSPIYLAELIYRAHPTHATLDRYRELVFETAELLASYPYFDRAHDRYILGPPIIPAQEVFPPLSTFDPTFELEYFRFGLRTAQQWRERLGLPRNAHWDAVLQKLAPLPQRAGLYLATESFPQLWDQASSQACSGGHTATRCWNRDHPSFLGALGLLPGRDVDAAAMQRTLTAVEQHWDLRQTWGWDFPLMAMTATRLHEPQKAVDLLLYDAPNNHFGPTGMTPRMHLQIDAGAGATGAVEAQPSYERDAQTYFPSNGGLLFAVALMAAGWDGDSQPAPGFPHDWHVRSEGIQRLP
jgi:hypothetical protein